MNTNNRTKTIPFKGFVELMQSNGIDKNLGTYYFLIERYELGVKKKGHWKMDVEKCKKFIVDYNSGVLPKKGRTPSIKFEG